MKSFFKSVKWKDYELFFVLYFVWLYVVNPIASFVRRLAGETHSMDVLILWLMLLFLFVNVVPVFVKRLRGWQFVFIFILLIALLLSSLFTDDSDTHSIVLTTVLIECYPIFLFAGCVRDFERVYKYMLIIMRAFACLSFFNFYVLHIGSITENNTYSAETTYRYMVPAIVLLFDVIKKFSLWSFIPFLISLFMVIGSGSRGPLVSVGLSMLLYLLLKEGDIKKRIKVILPVALLGSAIVYYSSSLLENAFGVMTDLEMSTRTIDAMTNDGIMKDGARSELTKIGMQRVFENPFVGTGLVNDRIYIKQTLHDSVSAHGWYPHNFFVEVLMQFGAIGGIVVLTLLFNFLYRSYKNTVIPDARSVLLVFFGTYFIPLLFSCSYLEWSGFYALIGLAGSMMTTRKEITSPSKELVNARKN